METSLVPMAMKGLRVEDRPVFIYLNEEPI